MPRCFFKRRAVAVGTAARARLNWYKSNNLLFENLRHRKRKNGGICAEKIRRVNPLLRLLF